MIRKIDISGKNLLDGTSMLKANTLATINKTSRLQEATCDDYTAIYQWEQWCHYDGDSQIPYACDPAEIISTHIYSNCPGGGGGTGVHSTNPPRDIRNKTTDTCIFKTVEEFLVANKNIEGALADIIKKLDKDVNVHIEIYDAFENDNHKAGQTSGTSWDPSNGKTNFYTKITLSKYLLLETSKEHLTAVLLHEVLHAYFRETTGKAEEFENLDHNTMANKYVNPVALYLSNLFNITLKDATALAWDGIIDTDAFINSNTFDVGTGADKITVDKQDLKDINTSYVLKTNGKGKGLCQ